jgi:hypothetical protein
MTHLSRRVSALLLVSLLVLSALVGATGSVSAARVAGNPDLELVAPENRLVPGAETELQVYVVNTGDVTDEGDAEYEQLVQTARSLTVEARSRGPVTVLSGETPVGTVPEGVSGPVPVRVRVDDGARPGEYDLSVLLRYEYTAVVETEGDSIERTERSRTIERDLEVVVERRPAFRLRGVESALAVGDAGTVELTLKNVGPVRARDATVTVTSTDPEVTFGTGVESAQSYVGEWKPDDTKRVSFRTRVADDALVRNYSVGVVVTYLDGDGQERTSRRLVAGVRPVRGAAFEVTDVDAAVAVGDAGTLAVELVNVGDAAATGATVAVSSSDPQVTFGAGAPRAETYVGDWGPDEPRRVTFRTRVDADALARPYSLDLTVTYRNPGGDRKTDDLVVGIDPGDGPAFDLAVDQSDLRVGSVGRVRGTVENVGGGDARDVVVRLGTEDPTLFPTDVAVPVGDLAAGETAAFEYSLGVDANASPGLRRLPFVVEYRSPGDDGRAVDETAVTVRVAPRRPGVVVAPQNATFEVDSSGRLVLAVTNEDDAPRTDVTVRLLPEEPLSSDDAVGFVPELAPGETASVAFDLDVSDDAVAKTHVVAVEVSYEDEAGRVFATGPQSVPVDVVRPQSTVPVVPALLVAAALLGAGVWWWRRR